MKFLADMGVSPLTVQVLRQQGYDAVHLSEQGLERLPDSKILEKARQENRIILTFDLDFADLLAASSQQLPSTIIFRLKDTKPTVVSGRLLIILNECQEELKTGAIVTINDTRYRLRSLPISSQ
ncbi:DUF5615 family PIN-like protein [Planktothrix mougeotii]|uniref:DUF5615 family PIN-like protein n=1 Tax=Planktothrix mougeotii LEGE 06226 TaxID=1828728 RepID=A0ABR9U5T1_9CYAN|nr:DUF5615 family PIN-like protein [Planktothrix mougeotii]MBE9141804.1 DUF5615 family PIN-like protein [Planktothrix mougeotii LEGE 06226]